MHGLGDCDPTVEFCGGQDVLQYPTTGGVSVDEYLDRWAGHEYEETYDAPRTTVSVGDWLKKNQAAVFAGVGILVAMKLMGGRR